MHGPADFQQFVTHYEAAFWRGMPAAGLAAAAAAGAVWLVWSVSRAQTDRISRAARGPAGGDPGVA